MHCYSICDHQSASIGLHCSQMFLTDLILNREQDSLPTRHAIIGFLLIYAISYLHTTYLIVIWLFQGDRTVFVCLMQVSVPLSYEGEVYLLIKNAYFI